MEGNGWRWMSFPQVLIMIVREQVLARKDNQHTDSNPHHRVSHVGLKKSSIRDSYLQQVSSDPTPSTAS
jgi:hypothetical protein